MKGFRFDATCPRCGGELEHVASGRVIGQETRAVASCSPCKREYLFVVSVLHAEDLIFGHHRSEPDTACGTTGGYSRHRNEGTETCGPCRAAHAAEQAERKLRQTSRSALVSA